jgi:hypothetical protein
MSSNTEVHNGAKGPNCHLFAISLNCEKIVDFVIKLDCHDLHHFFCKNLLSKIFPSQTNILTLRNSVTLNIRSSNEKKIHSNLYIVFFYSVPTFHMGFGLLARWTKIRGGAVKQMEEIHPIRT